MNHNFKKWDGSDIAKKAKQNKNTEANGWVIRFWIDALLCLVLLEERKFTDMTT